MRIFRRFITTKNGRKLDAHWFGLKAFPIDLPDTQAEVDTEPDG